MALAVCQEGRSLVWHFVALIACAVAIYLSCEWFVNAVEWLGQRLHVGKLAVGTILAAFGTALPESIVTFVAVVFTDDSASKQIGIGAAMGGPLALSTVAYGVTGAMLLFSARQRISIPVPDPATVGVHRSATPASPRSAVGGLGDTRKLAHDQAWFLVIFIVKVGLGLVAFAVKPWLGLVFFAAYAVYFWREIRAEGGEGGELEPLLLQRDRRIPATWVVMVQTLGSLAIIFGASQLFVRQLDAVGPMLGLPAAVTALLLSPIATELPEIMNAIIWVRQKKTALALANISGAMMIQATVPSGLGLLFTPWRFDTALLISGLATMAAIVYLLILLRRRWLTPSRLAYTAGFYGAFAIGLALTLM